MAGDGRLRRRSVSEHGKRCRHTGGPALRLPGRSRGLQSTEAGDALRGTENRKLSERILASAGSSQRQPFGPGADATSLRLSDTVVRIPESRLAAARLARPVLDRLMDNRSGNEP